MIPDDKVPDPDIPANVIQGETPLDPDDYRPCHECGELVRMAASKCRFCGAVLGGCPPMPALISRVSAILRETTKDVSFVSEDDKPAFRLRDRTKRAILWMILMVILMVILSMIGFFEEVRGRGFFGSEDGFLLSAWFSSVCILLIPAIYWSRQDLELFDQAGRLSPENSFKSFLHAMRYGRWDYAYSFLLPGDKNFIPRARVKHEKARIGGGVFTIDSVKNFQKYWQPMTRSSWIISRRMNITDWQIDQVNQTYAVASCRYVLTVIPDALFGYTFVAGLAGTVLFGLFSGILFMVGLALLLYAFVLAVIPWLIFHFVTKHIFEVKLTKYLRKVGDQWFIICGDIQSRADMLPKLYVGDLDRLERGELPAGYDFSASPVNDSAMLDSREADSAAGRADKLASAWQLPLSVSVSRLKDLLCDARSKSADNQFPHDDAKRYGRKIRWLTLLFLAGIPLSGLLIVAASVLFPSEVNPVFADVAYKIALVLAISGASVLGILFGVALYDDIRVPSANDRTDPLRGFLAWFRGMQTGRWHYALHCILPEDRNKIERPRPTFNTPRVHGGPFMVCTAKDLSKYWRPLLHGIFISNRSVHKVKTSVEQLDLDHALVHCSYHLPSDGFALTFFFLFPLSWILRPLMALIFKSHEMGFVKYMHRVDGLWYVATADLQTGIDSVPELYRGDFQRLMRGEMPHPITPINIISAAQTE